MAGQATERLVGGRYALIEPIGRGGMGVVWRARDQVLERDVAVKEIHFPPGTTEDERRVLRTRVFREARAAARLSHPCVVTVYDVIEEADRPFIVMELVDAPSLADVVRDQGPLAPAGAAKIGLDILSALEMAHAAGVIHRDIKPGNVMVRLEGHSELADFGIASVKDDPSVTSTGLVLGSPAYMAPEQATHGVTSPASDLWSLGATLYFAVEGSPPFEGDGAMPTLTAVIHAEPRPMRTAGSMSPLLGQLLNKDPEQRPGHAEVRRLLERVTSGAAGAAETLAATAAATRIDAAPSRPEDTMQLVRTAQVAAAAAPLDESVQPPRRTASLGGLPDRPAREFNGRERRTGWPVVIGLAFAILALAVGAFAVQAFRDRDPDKGRTTDRATAKAPGGSTGTAKPKGTATAKTRTSTSPSAVVQPTPSAAVTPTPKSTPKPTPTPTPTPDPTPSPNQPGPGPTPDTSDEPDDETDEEEPDNGVAADGVPAGWRTYRHPTEGFSVKHPPNWSVARDGLRTRFSDPASDAMMLVEYTTSPGADPDGTWRANEPGYARRNSNYERIRIEPTTFKGYDAGVWEWTHTNGSGRDMHTLNLGFVTGDYGFALLYQTRADQWSSSQAVFEAFKQSFRAP